jgi:aspartate racemase
LPAVVATLGIIGGAGVGAAARLYEDVCARVHAATGGLPRLALWNLPLSDALEHAFMVPEPDPRALASAEELVAEAFERLAGAGATVVAMPCNSLQGMAAREAGRRGVPFVDMIAATIEEARGTGADAAVLIATESTLAGGIYEQRGVEIIEPPDPLRDEAQALIARAIAGPPPSAAEMTSLFARARQPEACVVVGCTDICGLAAADAHVIESLGCLAQRCAETLA